MSGRLEFTMRAARREPRRELPAPARTVVAAGAMAAALKTGRTRLLVAGAVFAAAFSVIAWRLVDLAILDPGREPGPAPVAAGAKPGVGRADIVDRNGMVMAASLPTASMYADPGQILDARAAAVAIAGILPGLSESAIFAKLTSRRRFVWLKRNLTPRQQYAVNRLGVPGLYFRREMHRFYPHGELAAHVVGFTDVDNKGLAGVERSFDDVLRGGEEPLALSLDLRVQHIMMGELATAMGEFRATGAAGIVLDAATGEVISMVSLPTFDPNRPGAAAAQDLFNRVSLGVYEMGSVFKIFTTAMVLDEGIMTLNDGFDTSRPIRVARFTITDYKPKNRWLSVPEIFVYSSNIGTVRMAMEAGVELQKAFLGRLGLTRAPSLELAEVGSPVVPSPWREINAMTISYGHGLAVSPIQLAGAVAGIVNGGVRRPVTLLRRPAGSQAAGRRVISQNTSNQMRRLMRLAVRYGTGRKAAAAGYRVGGKTGTANKLVGGRYARDARVSSFVGAFPMSNPRYVVFAMLDEPRGNAKSHGYATGGWVAAPVVRRVIERIGPLLGVAPAAKPFEAEAADRLLVRTRARANTIASN